MKRKIAVALVAVGMPMAAHAITGNEMLANCEAALKRPIPANQMVQSGVCMGYVMGIGAGFTYAQIANPEKTAICMPEKGYTFGQGARVLTKYLNDHPERLNYDVSLLALDAFRIAFPCN